MPDRDELERRLARRVSAVERRAMARIREALIDANAVAMSAVPDEVWARMEVELLQAIEPVVAQAAMMYVQENAQPVGVPLDEVADSVQAWAAAHAASVAALIVANARRFVSRAVDAADSLTALVERLRVRFSPAHAEQVAITEVTRGISRGAQELQDRLLRQNVRTVRRWLTAEDERVCPICRPLDHATYESGAWDRAGVPEGPPAHPNCRCQVVVEYVND